MIQTLLNLVNALLTSHGDAAPFQNHLDLHAKTDMTTVGEAPWNNFTLHYNGLLPNGVSQENAPMWMTEEHEIWFHTPVTLLEIYSWTQILKMSSIIHLIKSMPQIVCTASMTSCGDWQHPCQKCLIASSGWMHLTWSNVITHSPCSWPSSCLHKIFSLHIFEWNPQYRISKYVLQLLKQVCM